MGPKASTRGFRTWASSIGKKDARWLKEFYEAHEFRNIAGLDNIQFAATMNAVDDWMFSLFKMSENMNRGYTFYSGMFEEMEKNKAFYSKLTGLPEGKLFSIDGLKAIKDKSVVGKDGLSEFDVLIRAGQEANDLTNFIYTKVGRSPYFFSPTGSVLGQWMNYPIKAGEFMLNDVLGLDKAMAKAKDALGVPSFTTAAMKRHLHSKEGIGNAAIFTVYAGGLAALAENMGVALENQAWSWKPKIDGKYGPVAPAWARAMKDVVTGDFKSFYGNMGTAFVPGGLMLNKAGKFMDSASKRELTKNDYILLANMYPTKGA
jgi:hypothetical protein